jgi:CsoR family transcriptional regulator, copper-sensing transcriptional repressor
MRDRAKELARQRLARMEGQVRGLLNMVEDERDAIDILTQVAALRAAMEGFGSLILTEHVEELIAPARGSNIANQSTHDRVERVREALARLIR